MTERLPHEKGFHVSWDQLHRDARALAWRLDGQGPMKAVHGALLLRSHAVAWRLR